MLGLSENKTSKDEALYRLVWRWHFYAGLFVAPFAILLALTGALYLFQPQIENVLYKSLYNIPFAEKTLSPSEQLDVVKTHFPASQPLTYMPPFSETQSALMRVRNADGQQMIVAVNPHTGAVLGTIDESKKLMQIVRTLHGKLLSGKIGQAVVELAASWLMVLLVTGLYLWWPRGRGLFGTLIPRFQKGQRIIWRDIHAVTGFWLSFFLVFMVLTGLPWSLVAGEVINKIEIHTGGMPQTGMGWDGGGSKTVKSETTHEGWATDHAMHMSPSATSTNTNHLQPLTLTQIKVLADKIPDLAQPYSIYLPVDDMGVYSVSSVQKSMPEATAYIHLDQYSGKVISETRWKDFSPVAKSIALGVSLHEGKYFGPLNQLLNLIVCLGLVGLVGAGITLWWKRRPVGRLGAPRTSSTPVPKKGLAVIIILLGILMPLMGASLILILAIESLYSKFGKK